MAAESLQDALVEELRDLLHAEKQLTKALPKLAKAAESEELASAFEFHLEETQTHVERLERALETLGETVRAKACDGMKGIVEEGGELIKEYDAGALRDAMLIEAAQKAEHYEIATYGTVVTWAKNLGLQEIAGPLIETLKEEKAADEKLTQIAGTINAQAEFPTPA